MPVIPTQTDYDIIQSKIRNSKVKIDVLNFKLQTIDSLEGICTDGSITIDADSDIRRTCSITLTIKKGGETFIRPGGTIWFNRYIKIYKGTDNPRTGETIWWNMGIFLINAPNSSYNATTNSIVFEGLDMMAKFTDKRGGELLAVTTVIPAGSLISDVVKQIVTQFGGFNSYIIENEGYTIPYDIKKEMGSTIYDLLVEIRDLYADWEMFFDTDGVFHWQKIPSGINDPVIVDFDQLRQKMVISDNIVLNFENVKNNIIVYGRLLDNGEQVMAVISDTVPTSPFSISNIGQINYIVNDERIYSNELAGERAKYELYIHARLNDSITLEVVPIDWLNDVNIKIKYTNEEKGIEGDYLIKNLTIPLGVGGNMNINAIKVYDEEVVVSELVNEYPMCGYNWFTSAQTQFPYFV